MAARPKAQRHRRWLLSVASASLLAPACAQDHGEDEALPDDEDDHFHAFDGGLQVAPDAGADAGWHATPVFDASYPVGTIVVVDGGIHVAPDGGDWNVYDAGTTAAPDAAQDAGCDWDAAPPVLGGIVAHPEDGGCWVEWVGIVARDQDDG